MLIYLVRHAESQANVDAGAGLNSQPSPLGRRQIDRLVERFGRIPIHAVYSSPFERCLLTAVPIARTLDLPVWIRPELCEFHGLAPGAGMDHGLDGMDAIRARHPEVQPCPDYRGPRAWPAIDEPFSALLDRARRLAAFFKGRWQGAEDTILTVSHGSPTARLIDAWLTDTPGPSFRFIIDNAAVSALRYTAGVSGLICLNEISHLRGLDAPAAANFRADGSIKAVAPSNYW